MIQFAVENSEIRGFVQELQKKKYLARYIFGKYSHSPKGM